MSHDEEIELDDEMLAIAAGGAQVSKTKLNISTINPDPVIAAAPSAPVVTNFSNHYMDVIN